MRLFIICYLFDEFIVIISHYKK